MMMPANFSAVNAEVVYGGAVADYLPNAWTAENVKRFNSNVITLISNSFTSMLLNATLGTMFSGNWGDDGVKLFGDNGTFSGLYNVNRLPGGEAQTFGNKIMTTLGLASVVYTLGMKDAAVLTVKKVTDINGNISMDEEWNVNGSYMAIEGITSPDGRCLGKMAHSERRGDGVAINIYGEQDLRIFESGVAYFK